VIDLHDRKPVEYHYQGIWETLFMNQFVSDQFENTFENLDSS